MQFCIYYIYFCIYYIHFCIYYIYFCIYYMYSIGFYAYIYIFKEFFLPEGSSGWSGWQCSVHFIGPSTRAAQERLSLRGCCRGEGMGRTRSCFPEPFPCRVPALAAAGLAGCSLPRAGGPGGPCMVAWCLPAGRHACSASPARAANRLLQVKAMPGDFSSGQG